MSQDSWGNTVLVFLENIIFIYIFPLFEKNCFENVTHLENMVLLTLTGQSIVSKEKYVT